MAIAKIAKQIQCNEHPQFDDIFIQFGQFHTELNIFSALGKLIEGSGAPYILGEPGVVASGIYSMNLKGKMYNRCRRAHILLASALHGLHFRKFVDDQRLSSSLLKQLEEMNTGFDKKERPTKAMTELAQSYQQYMEGTLIGNHGKTGQFWMQYCKLVELYLTLHRAVKLNDVDLYAYSLFELSGIFFMVNHMNYSRWMTYYALELFNLKIEKPGFYQILKGGGFSVNRTGKVFSSVGVDMALEETINAEAKSRLKGIIAFADISTAVNRWVVTGSMRSQIVNRLLETVDMKIYDSGNKEQSKARLEKDKKDLEKIKDEICATTNPFQTSVHRDDVLFNLRTGKQASESTENFLLSFTYEGRNRRDGFVRECTEDSKRFEKAIKKTKILNFAAENFEKKNKSRVASTIAQTKGTRDMFGRLVYLSVKNKLNLRAVFEYPLLSEPACFAHPDGTIRDSPKSNVATFLKTKIQTTQTPEIDAVIVDGMFMLRLLIEKFSTYQTLARNILKEVLKMTTRRADLVFDVYESPSIKDIERKSRGNEETLALYSIGPKQKIEGNVKELLANSEYKKELLRFLYNEYEDPTYAPVIGDKIIYLSVNNMCRKFLCVDEELRWHEEPSLYGDHLEADTRVMFHAKHGDANGAQNIAIRGNDTDILIILLSNISNLYNSKLWYDCGLDFNNSREFIDIDGLKKNLPYATALAGIYGFLGNDYSPAFFKKGKVKPIEIMARNEKFIAAFESLGAVPLSTETISVIEEFVCWMYGYKNLANINEVRYRMFEAKSKPSSSKRPLDGLKSIESTSFPPCQKVLLQQIKRAWYLAKLYRSASEQYPCLDISPIFFGWKLFDGQLEIHWFDGEQVPPEMECSNPAEEMEGSENESESDTDGDSCESEDEEDDADIL